MASKKDKVIKGLLSSFLAFFLSVLFTVGTCFVCLYIGFFTNGRILDGLNYKDYYSSVETYFYENAKDSTLPSGLPPEILDGAIDSDTIHSDVRGYVQAMLEGKEYTFSVKTLKENLTENIHTYFKEQNIEMTQLQKDTLPEYVQSIADLYVEDIKVPIIQIIPKIKQPLFKITVVVLAACLVLSAAVMIVMLRMYRWKHRAIRYLVYSTTATAAMVAIPAFAVHISGFFKRINISAEHTYHALTAYLENGFFAFYYGAVFWVLFSLGLLALISYLKKRKQVRK